MLRKTLLTLAVLFVVYYMATQPDAAAAAARHGYNGLHAFGQALARFLNAL